MAWSAVSSAVTTIKLLTQEAKNLWGVKEQVDRLQRELEFMRCFLIDADARQGEGEGVRLWVTEIRDLAYDAEDVVEAFVLRTGSEGEGEGEGGFCNVIKSCLCILNEAWMLHKTRSKLEKIMTRITDLTRQLQTYGIQKELKNGEGSSSSEWRELRRSYPHIIEDNVVGMDDDIKQLVSVLVDERSDCRVVSIWGMGGLGKTTLAKRVYRHRQVRGHFNRFAWVYVSQQCQRRRVWEDMLSGLISPNERGSKLSDAELAEKLFNFLKDKKCLVILDDIWTIEAWNSLEAAFPTRDTTSKVLLTSRKKELVSHADRRGYLHELHCLKEEESWELFQKIAFPDRDSPDYKVDRRMEELGKSMVKHCAGLPLAIIVLGGILASKSSLNEWKKVCENVKANLNGGKSQGGTEDVFDVLALSYDDLPAYLRPCFLYLSVFPEDYEIHAQGLIQLWVAEGIISSTDEEGNGGEIIEDVAERYLIELVERCMIQVRERNVATFKIKTFHMHDLMRDLCLSKAKQEKFVYIVDESITFSHGNNFLSSTTDRARRIAAHNVFQIESIKSPHLRSLLLFNGLSDELWVSGRKLPKHRGSWTYMFNNFKLLRVIDELGKGEIARDFSSDIGNLIHLRYLRASGVNWPSSLGNLRRLWTLDLRPGHKLGRTHVPDVIWRMEQLRHLYLPRLCDPRLKLGTLKNLQTLVNFNTKSCYIEDLHNMTNLKELKICWPFNNEDFKEDLNTPIIGSQYLRSLSIDNRGERIDPRHWAHLLSSCVSICELSLKASIQKLPEHHCFSEDIAYIYLASSKLDEDPMPILEKLYNLRFLKLDSYSFIGKEMICSAQGFPRLDSLSLRNLLNLEEWKVEEGAMPALRSLLIHNCRIMKKLPDGLSFMTTLQELTIENMPKEFKDKLVEGGEDFHKVQHIPPIIFQDWC